LIEGLRQLRQFDKGLRELQQFDWNSDYKLTKIGETRFVNCQLIHKTKPLVVIDSYWIDNISKRPSIYRNSTKSNANPKPNFISK
jgi:hypothetical protein